MWGKFEGFGELLGAIWGQLQASESILAPDWDMLDSFGTVKAAILEILGPT